MAASLAAAEIIFLRGLPFCVRLVWRCRSRPLSSWTTRAPRRSPRIAAAANAADTSSGVT
eukprot:1767291-Prymnesium_polylepis.1